MKACSRCGVTKELVDFHSEPRVNDGRTASCRLCLNQRSFVWNEANRDKRRTWNARWNNANLTKCSVISANHRAAKLQATPSWADQSTIACYYSVAAMLTREGLHQWGVDHIVPLQSKRVCGLHTQANLQLLTHSDNAAKGNRHWPNM